MPPKGWNGAAHNQDEKGDPMKFSKTHVLLVGALLVAGCAATNTVTNWLDGYAASPVCKDPQCNYKIAVTSCSESGIRPEYNPIHVDKGTHRLHWVITTPGYTFDTSGIAIKGNPREFTNGTRVNPREFSWTDTNDIPQGGAKKTFKYDVKILDSTGKVCLYDPSIVNE
jgi:hypothetical protein